MKRFLLFIVIGALLITACDEKVELDDKTYARMTADLLRAGFTTPDADRVYEEYGVSSKEYKDYGKALEKDTERQKEVARYLKEELGEDWAEWSVALGQGMAKIGLKLAVVATEFGTLCVEAMSAIIPAVEEGIGEFATGLAEKLGELDKAIEEGLERLGEEMEEVGEAVEEALGGVDDSTEEEETEPPE